MTPQLEMASPAQGQPTGKRQPTQLLSALLVSILGVVPTPWMSIYGLKSRGQPRRGHSSSCLSLVTLGSFLCCS